MKYPRSVHRDSKAGVPLFLKMTVLKTYQFQKCVRANFPHVVALYCK